ncbi:MAG: efflux RND transporter permease subunit [Deltaproteobacteria bacterium]|nr:efflux RND transporter permease subunit [Deltaproteobacteria bacterium]
MDRVILWSIQNRLFVVVAALALTVYGAITASRMPVDVFPDLTAPTVTVVTEAHGLAPQEVETLVTFPIESAVNGATSVRRVRSASGIGISVVWVEFDWGTDIYVGRQIVNEKLQVVASQIPPDIPPPTLAPISSIMGEIQFIAVTSERHDPLALRETADWVIRKRLLAIPGVAQVVPIGGEVKQFQVVVQPEQLARFALSLADVMAALEGASQNATGGFLVRGSQEQLIRAVGRATSMRDLERTVVAVRDGVPILVEHLARVEVGAGLKRGTGSANAKPAVVMAILKQPAVNTLALSEAIEREVAAMSSRLPDGMRIDTELFRQADFITTAVENVGEALRDGAILVAIILFLFLFNVRATLISLAALPLSLLAAALALKALGVTINTMTLGGLTIAIGALVDDAIIDVENIVRRMREARSRGGDETGGALRVIYEASREVRASIVFATVIVMLVFVPVFFLGGVEGRMLVPLGFAYLVAIFASLVVALTVTPALCAYLLPGARSLDHPESGLVRFLKRLYRPSLGIALARPWLVIGPSAALLAASVAVVPFLGTTFLPEFNEGALTISAVTLPGTSLETSDRLGRRVEEILLTHPEVVATDRRTGRAELDEHAQDVNASEIDVRLRRTDRPHHEFLSALRADLSAVPGVVITLGQPISHRIDHMLSGTRASIAVKLFGPDLAQLRSTAEQVRGVMAKVDGAVDVSVEQQVDLPQLAVVFDRDRMARYGLRAGDLAELVEAAYAGHTVTQVIEQERTYDVVVRYPASTRADLGSIATTLVDTPVGAKIPLEMIADVRPDVGPNLISRENAQRKLVVMANVSGRDLGGVIADIQAGVARDVSLPPGYHIVYGGQFESQQEATRTLVLLGAFVVAAIFLLLYLAFRSARSAALVMVNLPLALIGGVMAVALTGGVLSIGSLVGFITLFGIATRNGILMISHYDHLREHEGASFDEAIRRGSEERLSPVLMTALCAGLALIPLVVAGGEPGNEIQAPMGVVILGGLLSSTFLNMILLPVLYARFATAQPAPAAQA